MRLLNVWEEVAEKGGKFWGEVVEKGGEAVGKAVGKAFEKGGETFEKLLLGDCDKDSDVQERMLKQQRDSIQELKKYLNTMQSILNGETGVYARFAALLQYVQNDCPKQAEEEMLGIRLKLEGLERPNNLKSKIEICKERNDSEEETLEQLSMRSLAEQTEKLNRILGVFDFDKWNRKWDKAKTHKEKMEVCQEKLNELKRACEDTTFEDLAKVYPVFSTFGGE